VEGVHTYQDIVEEMLTGKWGYLSDKSLHDFIANSSNDQNIVCLLVKLIALTQELTDPRGYKRQRDLAREIQDELEADLQKTKKNNKKLKQQIVKLKLEKDGKMKTNNVDEMFKTDESTVEKQCAGLAEHIATEDNALEAMDEELKDRKEKLDQAKEQLAT